jgi:hypothetical protein
MSMKRQLGHFVRVSPLILFIVYIWITEASAQITTNVFRRVLLIQTQKSKGTSFTIDVDNRQYLVTAKHLVAGLKSDDRIEIFKDDKWLPIKVKVLRCEDPIDIAVLIPTEELTVTFPLEPTMEGIVYGQDVFFVGFPYGQFFTRGLEYPIAFARKAIVSALNSDNGLIKIFLDGQNNPGFSGGPIVFRDPNRREGYKVAVVIVEFTGEPVPVLKPIKIQSKDIKPEDRANGRIVMRNDQTFKLVETGNEVMLNTGIAIGHGISHAVDLIRKNPIGPKISGK